MKNVFAAYLMQVCMCHSKSRILKFGEDQVSNNLVVVPRKKIAFTAIRHLKIILNDVNGSPFYLMDLHVPMGQGATLVVSMVSGL